MTNGNNKKVFVGLSGGVDSSVSAALLKEEGYDVTGVFIKVWQPDWIECSATEDRLDAMRVCAHLGIKFTDLDLAEEYKKGVVDYMTREYERGRTPNPDVMCNRVVKFGAFWKWAQGQGADYIATGHYARVRKREFSISNYQFSNNSSNTKNSNVEDSSVRLLTGVDTSKDQSYFLWTLTQDDLSHIIFPIGEYEKAEVRKMAKRFKLPTAEKKDSQGLCFIGKVPMKEFLSHFIKSSAGDVLDSTGKKIGTHPGAVFFTEGQRHGFTIDEKRDDREPLYVSEKDMAQNTITVVSKKNLDLGTAEDKKTAQLENVNWISTPEVGNKEYGVRIRYRQGLQLATLSKKGDVWVVNFKENQSSLPAGQSLVVYDGEVCVGGGVVG
ncbi:MAG: tRNA 2-thiouridine(34) synthase MnmA [Parcubacteria group bacterium CG11_big_fil_rev_8_21_14_0_20_39_22]|nr:MAG: tRNA 2-thiouridine(34) synthase MnmA [Parcubacteria group bacterium CG11_big_fil_rev_8_21_14_0_20_39_22]